MLTLATSSLNFSVYYHSHVTRNPWQNIATPPLGLQYSGKEYQVYPRYLWFHLPPHPIFCKCTTMNGWKAALWQTEVNTSCHFVKSPQEQPHGWMLCQLILLKIYKKSCLTITWIIQLHRLYSINTYFFIGLEVVTVFAF